MVPTFLRSAREFVFVARQISITYCKDTTTLDLQDPIKA